MLCGQIGDWFPNEHPQFCTVGSYFHRAPATMSEAQAGERNFHFYSILLDDFSKQLQLPGPFVNRCISKRKSGTAILQGPSGEIWRVELTVEGSCGSRTWCLRDGWDSFARDNSLKEFDFLLFKYEGFLRFRVSVFDKNACERRGSLVKSGSNVHGPSLESSFDYLRQCSHLKRKQVLDPPSSALDVESDSSRKKKPNAWEAANSFTSKFPFFCTHIKRWYADITRAILVVPRSFPMVHLPQEDSVFAFHLPEGSTSWEVTYCSRPTKRFFTLGWRLFACKNNLGEGDACVFELVGRLEMQVHIFRSADPPAAVSVLKKRQLRP